MNEWQKVKMFRCVQDPMIGPKPRNAFMLPDLPDWEAYLHTQSGTIHVKTNLGRMHVIGMGNWSSIELEKEEYGPFKDKSRERAEETQSKTKSHGRQKLQPSQGI